MQRPALVDWLIVAGVVVLVIIAVAPVPSTQFATPIEVRLRRDNAELRVENKRMVREIKLLAQALDIYQAECLRWEMDSLKPVREEDRP